MRKIEINDIDLLVNSVSQILTPVANQFLNQTNGLLLQGVFQIANMTEETYESETKLSPKDPYSIDLNAYNDIFKVLISALPIVRNVKQAYQIYMGTQMGQFIRRGIISNIFTS